MARKPVKIVTDLQVNKQISKVDSNNNILFDVSGTAAGNGHVSSSLPLTASAIYTPGNLEVGGTITANQYHVTYQTSSILTTSGSTRFGNSSDDIHEFTGSVFVSQNVTANVFYGTASVAINAQTASYIASGSAIQTFVSDVRNQFTAGTDININNGVISYTGAGGGGVSAAEVSGAITSSIANLASRSEITGVLNSYVTLIDVSSSFATPQQVTSAISNLPSRAEVTGALGGYLLISAASSSFAELTDLTASNITNFTSDVRAQFNAGPNIVINDGVITGSASGASSVEVSGAITGALTNYATLIGVSSSFATFSNVTSALTPYALSTNVSSSFTTPSQVSGAITGALSDYATLVGVSSSFVTPNNVTSALEPYALSANVSSSFVVPQQVTSAISNLASRAEVTGALGGYLLISAASSSFAELSDLTASNITNFTSDVRAQFSAGPNIVINNGVITGSASGGGLSTVETSGSITGSGIVSNPVTLKDPLVIGTVTASLGFNGNLNGTASYATNAATASTSFIGAAEDGDYTDGLFTDITTVTPVGTVIDRFNEVLKALAPSPAPDLFALQRTAGGSTGVNNMRLGFGTGANEVVGYTSVTASLPGLSNVSFTGLWSTIESGSVNGFTRLGVFATGSAITMSLNNTTPVDSGVFTNYPAKAYNVTTDGVGTYILEVNDIQITPTGSSTTTSSVNTATFALTTANTGTFTSSGRGLSIFRHRTGTVGVPTNSWRYGHNYAKVTHISSLGTHVTNYVDWIYDPSGSSGVDPYSITTPTSASFNPTGTKYLSGIKYYSGLTYNYSSSISNYYKNTYSTTGLSMVGTNLTITTPSVSNPTLNTDILQVNALHTVNSNTRLLGNTLTSTLSIANGLGKTGTSILTTNTILLDSTTNTNTAYTETFTGENYRISSGSYDTQNSASTAYGLFPSSSALSNSELVVYDNTVRYPTQILNSGNVSGSSIVHKYSEQPNYSGVSENRFYYRIFQNGDTSNRTSFILSITGSNPLNVIGADETLDLDSVKIRVKVPGKTGWRDVTKSAPGDTSGVVALQDGVGAFEGSITSTATTSQHNINLVNQSIGLNEYFIVCIEASSAWEENISRLVITGVS